MKKMKKNILALACLGLALTGAGAYQLTNAQTAQADGETITPTFACAGASIRLDSNTQDGDTTGIRFRVKMDNTTLTTATAGGKEVRILVMPTDLLGDGVLDLNDTGARDEALTAWADFVNDDGSTNANYKQAYAYTYGMTEAEWNRPTTWRAYYLDSNDEPVYSNPMERSLSEVALSCENDETETDATRKEKAGNYILTYNFTYDHGVRGTDGEWKTTTTQYRYGTELTELPTAPTLDTREDFEFLAWETTKGADKLKVNGEKTVITGNVTKEAYWLLTGEISLDSPEKVAEYADFVTDANTEMQENPTDDGVAFKSGEVLNRSQISVCLDWKNIVVNTDLNCRFKGYVTSIAREDGNHGCMDAFFETGDTDEEIFSFVLNQEFDEFTTQDVSTFETYGSESGYYQLADFVLAGNINRQVNTYQTATFEKFQIGAVQQINKKQDGNQNTVVYKENSWSWLGNSLGFNLQSDAAASAIQEGTGQLIVSDSYLACKTATKKVQLIKVKLPTSTLPAGSKIVLKIKTAYILEVKLTDSSTILGHSTYQTWYLGTNGEFSTLIVNLPAGTTSSWWLNIGGAHNQAADFVIESIDIQPDTITTDVPQYLSGANDGAQSVTLDNTGTVNQGVITGADNVKYAFVSDAAWSGNAVTFNFKDIVLKEGDQIYLRAKGTANASIQVNGNTEYSLAASETCDQAVVVYTVPAGGITLKTLSFNVADVTSVDFTVYQLYIVRA